MEVSYSFIGEPTVTVYIDIPKMPKDKVDAKMVVTIRSDIYTVLSNIPVEKHGDPQEFATEVFSLMKKHFPNVLILAVVFNIKHETGQTTMTYTAKDVNLQQEPLKRVETEAS